MKLTIKDRFILSQSLPQKGNYMKMIVLEDLQKKIRITQEEIEKCEIKVSDSQTTWKDTEYSIDIDFSTLETTEIKSALIELSKAGELTMDSVQLYKLFEVKE